MEYADHLGSRVLLQRPPMRIVSVVPSITELLIDLGLEDRLVGITKFCIHPDGLKTRKTIVGGTKTLRVEAIRSLRADLVIANKEENVKDQIEAVRQFAPVWVSDIRNISDVHRLIADIAQMVALPRAGRAMSDRLRLAQDAYKQSQPTNVQRAVYLIWRKPYMTVGGDTFIHSMLSLAGFENAFGHQTRYPSISAADIQAAGVDCILLSDEPFPFAEKHIEELRASGITTPMLLVDGSMFSWYGSRAVRAFDYFRVLRQRIGT